MSRLRSLVPRCVALAAAAVAISGCASLWPGSGDDGPTSAASRPSRSTGVWQASDSNDNDVSVDPSMLGSFSWEGLKKKTKKLFGKGTNKELARKLYREADD